MKFYYDLHIHTCLSPCADDDMTPCNIAGMAMLAGLDVIAVTDHNSCLNCRAVMKASAALGGPLVIPGMELETSENVHIVLLFPDADRAEAASEEIYNSLFRIANKEEIYGNQLIMNSEDEVIGKLDQLLVVASEKGVYDAVKLAEKYGGAAFPAHIDRPGNGILEMLGDVSEDMGFGFVEFSPKASQELKVAYDKRGYGMLVNSDSHNLGSISERVNYIELDRLNAEEVIKAIKLKE